MSWEDTLAVSTPFEPFSSGGKIGASVTIESRAGGTYQQSGLKSLGRDGSLTLSLEYLSIEVLRP